MYTYIYTSGVISEQCTHHFEEQLSTRVLKSTLFARLAERLAAETSSEKVVGRHVVLMQIGDITH
jgi:hypothetical protein